MEELSFERGKEFILAKPSFWRERYELQSSSKTLAKLYYPRWFSENSEISFINGKTFEIYSKGLLRMKHYIREKGYENPIAEYEAAFFQNSSDLLLPMGGRLRFVYRAIKDAAVIQSENGATLVSVSKKSLFSFDYKIYIENSSELIEKYPWAILFLCYKLIQRRRRRS